MRININFVLDSQTEQACKKINALICKHIHGCEIDFKKDSLRPHITLFMGEIDDNFFDGNYKKIKNLVKNLQFSAVGKTVKFGDYYFINNYLLCAVATDLDCFKQDSEMLIKRIDTNVVTPHKYQIVYGTATPHITIGYFNESQYDKAFVDSLPKLTEATIVGVDCSPSGTHGVVKKND